MGPRDRARQGPRSFLGCCLLPRGRNDKNPFHSLLVMAEVFAFLFVSTRNSKKYDQTMQYMEHSSCFVLFFLLLSVGLFVQAHKSPFSVKRKLTKLQVFSSSPCSFSSLLLRSSLRRLRTYYVLSRGVNRYSPSKPSSLPLPLPLSLSVSVSLSWPPVCPVL